MLIWIQSIFFIELIKNKIIIYINLKKIKTLKISTLILYKSFLYF